MHNTAKYPTRAFTLIELLVVCSIISILAVIALPNFSEAQTRTKVAVVKNNLRTVSHKFELLNVDTNRYPHAGRWRQILLWQIPYWRTEEEIEDRFRLAYQSMYGRHEDPFEYEAIQRRGHQDYDWLARNDNGMFMAHGFLFFHPAKMIDAIEAGCSWHNMDMKVWKGLTDLAGGWVLYSCGPDLIAESPLWLSASEYIRNGDANYDEKRLFREYDPTNGTISYGNIFRSQRNTAGLGVHPDIHD